jgi:hypothetical protein
VDIVVPFAGSQDELDALVVRMRAIEVAVGDTLTIVDNRPNASVDPDAGDVVVSASAERSSYYARNRGAERGAAPWLLFLDADVDPPSDLLARYFATEPRESTGVVGGGIRDAPLPADPTRAERYAVEFGQMSQDNTLGQGIWAYAQTANALVRRRAFEQVGGFEEGIRSGGDADLCFRIRAGGWQIESRPAAEVVHHNRATTRAFLRQKLRHGSGIGWLDKRYPGAFPPRKRLGYLKWFAEEAAKAAGTAARGERERAADEFFPVLVLGAIELGRFFPNKAPTG